MLDWSFSIILCYLVCAQMLIPMWKDALLSSPLRPHIIFHRTWKSGQQKFQHTQILRCLNLFDHEAHKSVRDQRLPQDALEACQSLGFR